MSTTQSKGKNTSKYNEKNKYNESNRAKTVQYQFAIGESVIYNGGLHNDYKGQKGVITKQSSKGHRVDYSIRFDDGREINCILEKVLATINIEEDDSDDPKT